MINVIDIPKNLKVDLLFSPDLWGLGWHNKFTDMFRYEEQTLLGQTSIRDL